ncbi:hypothetical protein OK016_01210 [Vibrio chagasii]|nr:hypothetical protein [Vibrio chagasii]
MVETSKPTCSRSVSVLPGQYTFTLIALGTMDGFQRTTILHLTFLFMQTPMATIHWCHKVECDHR